MKKLKTSSINFSSAHREGFVINEDSRLDKETVLVAKKLADDANKKPIILLSGPSGSGKTTTAFRIEKYLDEHGTETSVISMDNYFKPHENDLTPEQLESPDRLDVDLFIKNLEDFIDYKPVLHPIFDFKTGKRSFCKTPHTRKENELLIVEGIHVLNPIVTEPLKDVFNGLYVAPRTRIELEEGNCIHPKKLRLLRRILRDCKYRGQSIESVILKAKTVNIGEDKYIMPHKNNAQIHIDTFASYEVPILKNLLYSDFKSLDHEFLKDNDLLDVLQMFEEIDELDCDEVVNKFAVLREFIGKSGFKY